MITLYRPLVHLLVHPLVQFSTRQYEIITASVSVWVFFLFFLGFFLYFSFSYRCGMPVYYKSLWHHRFNKNTDINTFLLHVQK